MTLENTPIIAPIFEHVIKSIRSAALLAESTDKVGLLQMMEIGELETLETAFRTGRNVAYLLQRKTTRAPALSFTNFWVSDGERDLLAERNSYLANLYRVVSGRALEFFDHVPSPSLRAGMVRAGPACDRSCRSRFDEVRETYGWVAGMIRNRKTLALDPHVVLAFPRGKSPARGAASPRLSGGASRWRSASCACRAALEAGRDLAMKAMMAVGFLALLAGCEP